MALLTGVHNMSGLPPISTLATSGVIDVVFSADQTRIYVALANGIIELFDLATGTKLGSWQVSGALNSISLSEDGTFLLATNPSLPVVLRIAADTGQVITSYSSTGSAFRDVEVVDARTAVVTGGQSVTLDLITGVMTPIANSSYYSSNSILSEDRHLTLFGEMGISNGPLAIYDDRVGMIVARGDNYQTIDTTNTTGFNNGIQSVSEAAGLVLQFIYHNSINIYDLSLKFLRTVSVGSTANGLAFDETGRFVYVHLLGNNETAAVVKYEVATWSEVERYPLGGGSNWGGGQGMTGNQLQVTDNGQFLTIFDSSGKLQLVDLRASDDAIAGTAGPDRLFGGAGADVIRGAGGNDVLGSAGMLLDSAGSQVPGIDLGQERDQLYGDDGDDLIGAGYGDNVDGSAGIDTLRLSFAGATTGVTFDTTAFASGSPISFGGGTIRGVELLEYLRGSAFSDVITIAFQPATATVDGGGGNDVVIAGSGPVVFRGGLGNDLFVTGSGVDTFDGGEGEDTIDYRNARAGVEVRLNAVSSGTAIGPGGDSIVNVEGINGSGFNDRLYGSNAANRIDGAAGNDHIDGGLGNDALLGGEGDDTLKGGAGTDILTGGSGNDTFQDTVAGLNGDTITDLAAGDRITFTDANLANFTFSLSGSTLTFAGGSLTLGSALSGKLVATAAAGGGIQLTLGTSPPPPPVSVQVARNDFNGDGRSDILWRNDNGTLTNWLGQADGSFVGNYAAGVLSLPAGWNVLGTGDFNGDGRTDVLWQHENGTVTDWLAQANGNFQGNYANAAYGVAASWRLAGTGDFNGDGRCDILWRMADGAVTNWSGNANGSFSAAAVNFQAGAGWNVAGTGDFNGDGRSDILWRHENGTLTSWLGQADGTFVGNYAAGVLSLENAWKVIGTGDFNGDGRDDVLWRNDNGVVTNWLSQANGSFAGNYANAAYQVDNGWQMALTGDINGDGRDDVVWRNKDGAVFGWLGRANGSFVSSDVAPIPVDNSWHVVPNDLFVS